MYGPREGEGAEVAGGNNVGCGVWGTVNTAVEYHRTGFTGMTIHPEIVYIYFFITNGTSTCGIGQIISQLFKHLKISKIQNSSIPYVKIFKQ